jgi:hypothetical protein
VRSGRADGVRGKDAARNAAGIEPAVAVVLSVPLRCTAFTSAPAEISPGPPLRPAKPIKRVRPWGRVAQIALMIERREQASV